jgi:hypothetical protein
MGGTQKVSDFRAFQTLDFWIMDVQPVPLQFCPCVRLRAAAGYYLPASGDWGVGYIASPEKRAQNAKYGFYHMYITFAPSEKNGELKHCKLWPSVLNDEFYCKGYR